MAIFLLNSRDQLARAFSALLCLMALPACAQNERVIKGRVLDESNLPIQGANVIACYSGWGLSNGQMVWDKTFCSNAVVTNHEGAYAVSFKGASLFRMVATKDGWTQARDFNSDENTITMLPIEAYRKRVAAAAAASEFEVQKRSPNEQDGDYYCRVLASRSQTVSIRYNGEEISVKTDFLQQDSKKAAIFAVRGSRSNVDALLKDAQIKFQGKAVNANFFVQTKSSLCPSELHVVAIESDGTDLSNALNMEVFLPSIKTMFDLKRSQDLIQSGKF